MKKAIKTLALVAIGVAIGKVSKKPNHVCLADDVECLVLEEKDSPKPILKIDRSDEPIQTFDNYLVRIKFKH